MAAIRLAALIAATQLITACGSGPAVDTGPLGNGGGGGGLCAQLPAGHVLSYGATWLPNAGDSPATVERVSLEKPHKLQLLASFVMPMTAGAVGLGDSDGWPAAAHLKDWKMARPAIGAKIPASAGRLFTSLIVVLKPQAKEATASAINVFYLEDGTHYQLQTHVRLVLLTGATCTIDWQAKYPG